MRKERLRDIEGLAQGHTVRNRVKSLQIPSSVRKMSMLYFHFAQLGQFLVFKSL